MRALRTLSFLLILSVCLAGTASGQEEEPALPILEIPTLEKAIDPTTYLLGPYDQLLVSLVGPESKTFNLLVLPEGDVFIPGIGAIKADGKSLAEFRERLAEKVNEYFKNISIYCYLQIPRSFRVFVTGEVKRPGAVSVSAFNRASDAINLAGGTNDRASSRLIRIEREHEVITIDLVRFLTLGDYRYNPLLKSGDRIHVHPGGMHASVYGLFWKRGHFEIIRGETVSDLIELGGGFKEEAVKDSVLISRSIGNDVARTIVIEADRYDSFELHDLDEMSTFNVLKANRRVFVFGATERSGRFFLAPDEGLTELLVRTGRFEQYADLDNVTLERKNGTIIDVDVREYLSPTDPAEFPLEDGDVLHVPGIHKSVAVGGEVQVPGQFPYSSDLTVAHYVGLAGGPTAKGSINRIVIYAPDGSVRTAAGRSYPNRGDVIIVKRSKSTIFGEFFGGLIRLGTVVISIIVLTR